MFICQNSWRKMNDCFVDELSLDARPEYTRSVVTSKSEASLASTYSISIPCEVLGVSITEQLVFANTDGFAVQMMVGA